MIPHTPGITPTLIKDQIIEDIVQEKNGIYLDFFHSKMIKNKAIFKKLREKNQCICGGNIKTISQYRQLRLRA